MLCCCASRAGAWAVLKKHTRREHDCKIRLISVSVKTALVPRLRIHPPLSRGGFPTAQGL